MWIRGPQLCSGEWVDAATGSEPPVPPAGWRGPGGPTIAEKAFDLDYDVERIFRFVADEIQYDPYAGVLRGAYQYFRPEDSAIAQADLLIAAIRRDLLPKIKAFLENGAAAGPLRRSRFGLRSTAGKACRRRLARPGSAPAIPAGRPRRIGTSSVGPSGVGWSR